MNPEFIELNYLGQVLGFETDTIVFEVIMGNMIWVFRNECDQTREKKAMCPSLR